MSKKKSQTNKFLTLLLPKGVIVLIYLGILSVFFYAPLFWGYLQPHKTLNVCAFTETFCQEALERFERMAGVKVNLTYVELDEQIYAKFKINEGEGYDVINISDFMVHMLSGQGMLQPLDLSKITNVSHLDASLLHQVFDEKNCYSVPHKWFAYGLIYDKAFFSRANEIMNLKFVFTDPQKLQTAGLVGVPYKICMLDSPQDSFFLAALYLFGDVKNLTDEQCAKIQKLLVEQKAWVECYTLYTVEYFLLTGIVPIAVTSSNFARKIVQNSARFDFIIPPDGGILVIENLAIPKRSKNKELAHQFINFMLSDAIARTNSAAYGWASSNASSENVNKFWQTPKTSTSLPQQAMHNLYIPLFSSDMRTKIDEIWLEVGCA